MHLASPHLDADFDLDFDLDADFDLDFVNVRVRDGTISKIPLMCDNTSAINLTKNQIQHSRTKHIEIRHHFIRDHVNNGDCEVKFIETNCNWLIFSQNRY